MVTKKKRSSKERRTKVKKQSANKRTKSKRKVTTRRVSPMMYVSISIVIVSLFGLIFAYNNFLVPLYTLYPNQIVNYLSANVPRLDIKMKSWMIDAKTNFLNSITVTPNRIYYKITNDELVSLLTRGKPYNIVVNNKTITIEPSQVSSIYLSDEVFSTYSGYVLYVYNIEGNGKIVLLGHVVFSSVDNNIITNVDLIGGVYYDIYGNKYYICPSNGELKVIKSYNMLPITCKGILSKDYNIKDPMTGGVIDVMNT